MSLPAFNRILARHLALSLKSGVACDKALVLKCYATAQREAAVAPRFAEDALAKEVQALCVAHDLEVIQRNREQYERLSLHELEAALYRVLNPDIRSLSTDRHRLSFGAS